MIEQARTELGRTGRQTVLFIDEVHRFSKTQQDALLAAVENRIVLLVGATTEIYTAFYTLSYTTLFRSQLSWKHVLHRFPLLFRIS